MDLEALKKNLLNLVDTSTILEDGDRAFWRSQLPTMALDKLQKLEGILTAAANIRMEEHVHEYFSLIRGKRAAPQTAA